MARLIFIGVLFLVSIVVSSFPSALSRRDECSNPVRDTCSFYADCVESRYDCGPTGYPLNYGQPYCQKFTAAKSQLSEQGKQWVSDTMLCLQTSLVPEALGEPSAVKTCQALHDKAFASHVGCYVQSGLCQLPPTDWWVIVTTVGFWELFQSWVQSLETGAECIAFIIWFERQVSCYNFQPFPCA
jgi:hypothetical protein